MRRLHFILGLAAAALLASNAWADITYSYVASQSNLSLKPGEFTQVEIYLQEKLTGDSQTFIGANNPDNPLPASGKTFAIGLLGAGFKLEQTGVVGGTAGPTGTGAVMLGVLDQTSPTTGSSTVYPDPNSAFATPTGFNNLAKTFTYGSGVPWPDTTNGGNFDKPFTLFAGTETVASTAKVGATVTVVDANTRLVHLGSVYFYGGTAASTTYSLTNKDISNGNTLTFTDLNGGAQPTDRINLDDTTAAVAGVNPAFIGARGQIFTITILNAEVPEPSSLILGGIAVCGGGFSWLRRRRSLQQVV